MFRTIFLFELQNGFRKPAVYVYFGALLTLTVIIFANGAVPAGQDQHFNSPYLIALWCAGMSMLMMLVTSSVMGTALYRDIEYKTHTYYLTYPISKAGYFWGRFAGAFVCLLFVSSAILAGIYIGSKLGPAMGLEDKSFYGPNRLVYYLHPFFAIALPNIVFTSGLFFGLVALTRNVKVIYTGGLILFLGYFLSIFFLKQTHNDALINLADPFGVTNIRNQSDGADALVQNNTLFPIGGFFLINRVIWICVGLSFLCYAYMRFNFGRFFRGKAVRRGAGIVVEKAIERRLPVVTINYKKPYNRDTLFSLFKIELNNIVRDSYFWIIISSGLVFLLFIFGNGSKTEGVPDLPRTIEFLQIDPFFTFLFVLLVFYTGETLHRDRKTGYAVIADTLPPPAWVLNSAKLLSLLFLAACFSLLPLLIGVPVQLAKGFYQFDFPLYGMYISTIILPKMLEMVFFAYAVHVLVNNKFVAHAVAVFVWVGIFLVRDSGIFDYNLLLYSYTPYFMVSDMDGLGHMAWPVYFFTVYWLLGGGLLVVLALLFYCRGVVSSFKERWLLAGQRFTGRLKVFAGLILAIFLMLGAYLYYNVSYLNAYLTEGEGIQRAVRYEKTLKQYSGLPLPRVTRIRMVADLYPDRQQARIKSWIAIVNKNERPLSECLVDANELSAYSLCIDGKVVPYTRPLTYARGIFNFLRPERDTAEFRLYRFRKELEPGDSAVLEVSSEIAHKGFENGLFASDLLDNGVYLTGFLPTLGYDDGDEVSDNHVRKKNGLPLKTSDESVADLESVGKLRERQNWDLVDLDLTLSTSGDQTAVSVGRCISQWHSNGRNYFHYLQRQPGIYGVFPILSAQYAVLKDTIRFSKTRMVNIEILYHPEHNANLNRFLEAYKDGLRLFSAAYGEYPYTNIRLAETSVYRRSRASMASIDTYGELYGWNADFSSDAQNDYCYMETAKVLAQQWWSFTVAPNNTPGSGVISEGLARYSALKLAERKYGMSRMRELLQDQLGSYRYYLSLRKNMGTKERPLSSSGEDFVQEGKAAVVLYGLADLIGEDQLNQALRDFRQFYAFRSTPPFAGSNDLYRFLRKYVPTDKQYYLDDSWQKITLYDNNLSSVSATPIGNGDFKVRLDIWADKIYRDGLGNEVSPRAMDDYVEIGVFAADTKDKAGRLTFNTLSLEKYKLTYGRQTLFAIVHGKPVYAVIDPYNKLIDKAPNDNRRDF